ncbi:uncharacterized mitochondrial protein AtMg00810-like [Beta vulgaris subsp. vulgaris]|uniref:uncharacterized mitochondrial protein AtMg00810-like n=1 Tax=Beta vulgaris subsp. vulgaris TaxID=3555 RepID=UPI0009005A51|nr:uncharacterized mitochondrial protein AtMg00810-like [Beta vulgaris subsp. vulgaris]
MDVWNAFLHGDLEEEVYMHLPPRYDNPAPGKVCRLRSSHEAIYAFKQYLCTCFHMKDLGLLKYFLGIEVARGTDGLFLSQRKCAFDVLTETSMLGCKPIDTPMEKNHKLAHVEGHPFEHPDQYRRLVGRLVSITRMLLFVFFDILEGIQNRVFCYLLNDLCLTAFCDSDWTTCPLTSYFVLLGRSPISWKTKKQPTISRSSVEAEYRAMAATTRELKWLKYLLHSPDVLHFGSMK